MKIKDLCSYAPKSRIKAGEAVENAKYLFFTSSADENKRYTDFQFDKEAIIMGTGGNATLHYYNGKFSVSTDCLVLFPNSKIKCKYLYYFFKSHMSVLEAGFKGAGLKHTNKKYIEEINVSKVPDLSIQEKIVSHLDTITENIEKLNRELELFDSLTKARFIEMFGDPQINEKGFTKAPMGEYLSLLTDFSSNGSYKALDSGVVMYDEPNYAWMVRTTDLESGDKSSIKYIDEKAYELLSKSKIFGGEIIMNKIGSARKIYIIPKLTMPASLGRNAFMFRYDERINNIFIYYLLTSDYGQREIQQYVRGAVTKTITKDDARAVLIIVPPLELQQQFADFVHQVDKSREEVKKSLEKTQQLYDSLMQEYFG